MATEVIVKHDRIKAYTIAGSQVALADLGTGDEFGTYPRDWEVRQVISSTPMVEVLATPAIGEKPVEGTHWRPVSANFVVKSVVLHRGPGLGSVQGVPGDIIGNYGTAYMTLLPSKMTIQCEESPCADLDEVHTPPTPPPPYKRRRRSIPSDVQMQSFRKDCRNA